MALTTVAPEPQPQPEPPVIGAGPVDWSVRDVFVGIGLFVAAFVGILIPIVPLAIVFDTKSTTYLATATVVSAAVYAAIVWIAARMTFLKYGGGWSRLGLKPPTLRTLGWGVAAWIGAFAVTFAYAAFINLTHFHALEQGCGDQVPSEIRNSHFLLALTAVVAVLVAPVCEELFFRGFVFPGIARSWGVPAGVVTSGFIFGASHLIGDPYLYKSLVALALVGCVFAFVYYRSGSLLPTMLAHFSFNLVAVISIAATTCHD